MPRAALGPTQPPTEWVLEVLSRLKRPERQADYSPPSSVEVKISGAIHLLSSAPSWRAQGHSYLVIKIQIIDSARLLALLTVLSFCWFFPYYISQLTFITDAHDC